MDFNNIGDTRILCETSGSSTVKMTRLAADATTEPVELPIANVSDVVALRDADGALAGFVARDGTTLKRLDLGGGETVLASNVSTFEAMEKVDDQYVFVVNGQLRKFERGTESLASISSGSGLDGFEIAEISSHAVAAGRDLRYAVLVDEQSTANDSGDEVTKLVEIDFDRTTSARVLQTAQTTGHTDSEIEFGDERIVWAQERVNDDTLVSIRISDGSRIELAKGSAISLSLSQARAPGNWTVFDPSSQPPQAIKLGGTGQTTLGGTSSDVDPVMFDSRGQLARTQRFALADPGADELTTYASAALNDSGEQLPMGQAASDFDSVDAASVEPHALVRLRRADTGDDDLAFIDPDESGSLTTLVSDPGFVATPVGGY